MSMSGSADVLNAISPSPPNLSALTAEKLPQIYDRTNYTFLFIPNFSLGMKHAASIYKDLGICTIFNLLSPLANPVDWAIKARIMGIIYQELRTVFTGVLKLSGTKNVLIIYRAEDLNKISYTEPTKLVIETTLSHHSEFTTCNLFWPKSKCEDKFIRSLKILRIHAMKSAFDGIDRRISYLFIST